jgi:hypothetical protein
MSFEICLFVQISNSKLCSLLQKKKSTFQKALSFGDHNWQRHCHDAFDHVGNILDDQEIDETIHEVDPALHNIVLDTPPDMFEVWGAHFQSHLSFFFK